ncbi:hypothetical protein ACHAXM_009790 [Skeletonema potamos]|jgi:uncharacterized protein YdcH (DUF465 family)
MKAATSLFFTVTVAINSRQCSAYVVVPPPSTSFFGITSSARQLAIRGTKKYSTTIGTRRTSSTCIYSVPYLPNIDAEGDDGSFFLRASQQASKDRYEMLKQGKDPWAISLSTASVKEEPQQQQQDNIAKEEVAAVNEVPSSSDSNGETSSSSPPAKADYDGLLSESPLAQSQEEEMKKKEDTEQIIHVEESSSTTSSTTLDEIKRVEDEIATVKSQMKYRFQKRLLDARLAYNNVNRVGEGSTAEEMEAARKARLAAADEVAKMLKSGDELEEEEEVLPTTASTSTVNAGEGSTAEEMEETRNARLSEADEVAKTLKRTVNPTSVTGATSTVPLEEEENEEAKSDPELKTQPVSFTPPSPSPAAAATISEEDASNAQQPRLSSDGKEIYEPSQSALSINQENVDNGLMVLTRSYLVLNSIVQRLEKDNNKK